MFCAGSADFNPRAPCGARPGCRGKCGRRGHISTHAPLAGRDEEKPKKGREKRISTHAPLAGRDSNHLGEKFTDLNFNPRAPCGARQNSSFSLIAVYLFQPTRPLRGATIMLRLLLFIPCLFQPTRPLRGATMTLTLTATDIFSFQPTRPLRGATFINRIRNNTKIISTHAPLAGRDYKNRCMFPFPAKFQPTRPLRGATAKVYKSLCTFLR